MERIHGERNPPSKFQIFRVSRNVFCLSVYVYIYTSKKQHSYSIQKNSTFKYLRKSYSSIHSKTNVYIHLKIRELADSWKWTFVKCNSWKRVGTIRIISTEKNIFLKDKTHHQDFIAIRSWLYNLCSGIHPYIMVSTMKNVCFLIIHFVWVKPLILKRLLSPNFYLWWIRPYFLLNHAQKKTLLFKVLCLETLEEKLETRGSVYPVNWFYDLIFD